RISGVRRTQRLRQRIGDRLGELEVHLRDRQRENVGFEGPPLGGSPPAQHGQHLLEIAALVVVAVVVAHRYSRLPSLAPPSLSSGRAGLPRLAVTAAQHRAHEFGRTTMDLLASTDLELLAERTHDGTHLSLYLPTHRVG